MGIIIRVKFIKSLLIEEMFCLKFFVVLLLDNVFVIDLK